MELKDLSSNWKKLQETLKKKDSPSSPRTQAVPVSSIAGRKRKNDSLDNLDVKSLRTKREDDHRVVVVVGEATENKKRRIDSQQPSYPDSHSLDKERSTRAGRLPPWLEKSERRHKSGRRKGMEEDIITDAETGVKDREDSTLLTTKVTSLSLSRRNSVKSDGRWKPINEQQNGGVSSTAEVGKYIAVDCEMVGVGPQPDKESALARVSIVNWNGDLVYDSFVRPKEKVTDWRTPVSGITPNDMISARSLEEVQNDVSNILDGKILIGHALRNDLEALMLSHPQRDLRDTAKYPPYKKIAGGHQPRLKILAAEFLGLKIQEGSHSSLEDARATMLLFRRDKEGFEREHTKRWPPVRVFTVKDSQEEGSDKKMLKKRKKKSRKR